MPAPQRKARYVVCLSSVGYEASLERRKVYRVLPDPGAAKLGLIRVVDESGEDYLYPKARFAAITIPPSAARALATAS